MVEDNNALHNDEFLKRVKEFIGQIETKQGLVIQPDLSFEMYEKLVPFHHYRFTDNLVFKISSTNPTISI